MHPLLLVAALGLTQEPPLQIPPPPVEAPVQAPAPTAASAPPPQVPAPKAAPAMPAQAGPTGPLTFYSEGFSFVWDRVIPMSINLDGLKVTSIFFNKRMLQSGAFSFLKDAEFGTRAQVEVTNTGTVSKIPGFAVAVLDKDGRLIGVASGGTKVGTIKPGDTETFDLNFTQVKERLALGDKFFFAIELRH